jgi:hypothetical protein
VNDSVLNEIQAKLEQFDSSAQHSDPIYPVLEKTLGFEYPNTVVNDLMIGNFGRRRIVSYESAETVVMLRTNREEMR